MVSSENSGYSCSSQNAPSTCNWNLTVIDCTITFANRLDHFPARRGSEQDETPGAVRSV